MQVQITWWKENECIGCDEVEFDSHHQVESHMQIEREYLNSPNPNYDRVEMRCPEADLGLSTDY